MAQRYQAPTLFDRLLQEASFLIFLPALAAFATLLVENVVWLKTARWRAYPVSIFFQEFGLAPFGSTGWRGLDLIVADLLNMRACDVPLGLAWIGLLIVALRAVVAFLRERRRRGQPPKPQRAKGIGQSAAQLSRVFTGRVTPVRPIGAGLAEAATSGVEESIRSAVLAVFRPSTG
jgi:hypothetical protein